MLESIALASARGLRVSLNVLTHPGVTDERAELEAMAAFLRAHPVGMVQTRTLNIDPDVYFARVGRPREPLGMLTALDAIAAHGVARRQLHPRGSVRKPPRSSRQALGARRSGNPNRSKAMLACR